MRWFWGFCLALALACQVSGKPATHMEDTEELEVEYMTELINKLLIPAAREAREMMDAEDELEDVEDNPEKMDSEMMETGESEALEDSEALREAKVMEVARFNNYIDAIYRRMNAALKAKLMDPMELNLDEKVKKNSDEKEEKSARPRVVREAPADVEELDEELDDSEFEERMGKPAKKGGNKNEKKKGKDKKTKEERQAERQKKKELKKKKSAANEKDKKMSAKEKRKANRKNKNNGRESRSDKKNKKNLKKNKNKGNKKKPGNNKKEGKGKGKKGRSDKENVHGKSDKNQKKARKGSDDKKEKMIGSLSGIATMMRDGDVSVADEENHKVVTSAFTVGPLQLQVSKIYGKGKARSVKTAKAITDVMSGTLVLKVKADGTAHVKKVVFKKPENVEVKGKLSDNNPRSLNYLRNSVNKMRPLAAMKILKTARYVLKSPSSKQ